MRASLKISEAFAVLGLEEGCSIDTVKATYKQVALRTHPDKNPDNPSATEEFQRVSEAYRVLVKHLDEASNPSSRSQHSHSFFNFHNGSEYSFSDDEYDDEYCDDSDDEVAFYLYIFENIMRSRYEHLNRNHHSNYRRMAKEETPEEYRERLRKSRQEQLESQARRKQEGIARKARQEMEREQERLEAEKRQKNKVEAKKAQAEAVRKSSEERAKLLLRQAQTIRSSVFAAAREGNSAKVKKGIWEDTVDAAGGEVKPGSTEFVKNHPRDPKETLLHIASTSGDLELVEWLDSHGADPEEKNSQGLTAFHVALKQGHIPIVQLFLESYPPKDSDSKLIYDHSECSNLISLALESHEPEIVWIALDRKLATPEEINQALTWATSEEGLLTSIEDRDKAEDIIKLLKQHGKLGGKETQPINTQTQATKASPKQSPIPPAAKVFPSGAKQHASRGRNNGGRGRGRNRGRGGHNAPPAH